LQLQAKYNASMAKNRVAQYKLVALALAAVFDGIAV
jgi:hypothetical protein